MRRVRNHRRSPISAAGPPPAEPIHSGHPGFALTEVIVVLICVSIMLMILLPAVLQARTAATRVHCQNNLKQLGLALTHYEELHQSFPPGYVFDLGHPAASRFGWAAVTLPFLDQQPLATQIQWSQPVDAFENQQCWLRAPPVFLCPADPQSKLIRDEFVLTPVMQGAALGQANYVASFGPGDMWTNPDDRGGVFSRNSHTRASEITDGLSHTFLLSERLNGFVLQTGSQQSIELKTRWPGVLNESAGDSTQAAHMVLFRAGQVPQSPAADERDAWSAHPDGVLYLMADGAVLLIPPVIDLRVYQALATKAGGEMEVHLPIPR